MGSAATPRVPGPGSPPGAGGQAWGHPQTPRAHGPRAAATRLAEMHFAPPCVMGQLGPAHGHEAVPGWAPGHGPRRLCGGGGTGSHTGHTAAHLHSPRPRVGHTAGRPRFLFRTSASPLQNAIFTTIDVLPLTKPPHVHSLQKCAGWDPSPGALGLSLPLNDWYAENSGRSLRPPDGPHGAAGSTGSTRPAWGQRTEAAVAAALGPAARRRGPPDAMPVPGRSGLQAQLGGPPHPVMFQTPG